MNDKIDEKIHEYFQNNKFETDDMGFSDKVMQKLPFEASHNWILYLAYLSGFLILIISGTFKWLMNQISSLLLSTDALHLPSLYSVLAFLSVVLLIWLFALISIDESFI